VRDVGRRRRRANSGFKKEYSYADKLLKHRQQNVLQ
jgi:hypothetical protein